MRVHINQKIRIVLAAVVSTIVLAGMAWVFFNMLFSFTEKCRKTTTSYLVSPVHQRLLDGIKLVNKDKTDLRPIAVVIDNSFDSWPFSGVENALLVYETIAEGAITRLLTIYDYDMLPQTIGPVRSLRPYFIDWANEVDAIIVHVGGSPEALYKIDKYDHINEFYEEEYFWRDDVKEPPHDVYTSNELILKGINEKSFATTTTFTAWQYGEDGKVSQSNETVIDQLTVNFSIDPYMVSWLYDKKKRIYNRYVNHLPSLGVQAKNIIVQAVPAQVIDAELRRKLSLVGEGRAWVFNRGGVIVGTWKKEKENDRTRFFDNEGSEVILTPGTTWVEVIDDEGKISF